MKSNKKILILADPIDDQKAGVHVYTKRIIEELKKEKNIDLIFIHKRENNFFNNTEHYIIPRKNIPFYGKFRKFFLIPKLIRKLKPDIVWEPCHLGPFNIPKSIKRVVTIHDLTPILFPKFHIRHSVRSHKLLLPRIIKNADLIFTNSMTSKKDILNYQKTKAKIAVIPLAVDKPALIQKENIKPYILYIGTIEPRKNLELLIDAFNELNLNHKLILAGEIGWKSDKIVKKAKESPNVILKNYISEREKAKLYKNADLFVYPSIYEGFGLPPLEALSYKIPVVCSNGGSLKEIYQGKVLIFPVNDKEKLKKQMLKGLKQKKTNHSKFVANFTWSKTAKKSLSEILSILR